MATAAAFPGCTHHQMRVVGVELATMNIGLLRALTALVPALILFTRQVALQRLGQSSCEDRVAGGN